LQRQHEQSIKKSNDNPEDEDNIENVDGFADKEDEQNDEVKTEDDEQYGNDKSDPMEIEEGVEEVDDKVKEEYDNDGDELVKKSSEKD
jgi:hypothetical protein